MSFLCACVSGRVQLKVKCEWVVVITATQGVTERETRTCLLCTVETDHLLLWLHNAPNHAESRRSSYSPVVSTAATTLTVAETASLMGFIRKSFIAVLTMHNFADNLGKRFSLAHKLLSVYNTIPSFAAAF